ncbi:MAG: hypothetical protein ACRDVE_03010 [Actinocrinis sp.]
MSPYNIRDLFGHFVRPRSREDRLCPHKCCRGKRIHPRDTPLIANKALLRAMTDDDFVTLLQGIDWNDTGDLQDVLKEADRRERRQLAAYRRTRDRTQRAQMERLDFEIEIEAKFLQAEHTTRGNMLSRAGRSARVDPRTLFYGPQARARKYGSQELNEWFDRYGRLTVSEYRRGRTRPASTRPAARATSTGVRGKRGKS